MDLTYLSNKFQYIKTETINFAPTLLISIMIFIIFYVIANYVENLITNNSNQNNIKSETNTESDSQFLTELNKNLIFYQLGIITYYSIIVIGIIFALVNLGFNVGTILTLLGALGLALGLALQETLKNIISGVYLAVSNTFKLGDTIGLRALGNVNPTVGQVIDFNLYYTTLIDSNKSSIIIIPNSMIQNNLLTNMSRNL